MSTVVHVAFRHRSTEAMLNEAEAAFLAAWQDWLVERRPSRLEGLVRLRCLIEHMRETMEGLS